MALEAPRLENVRVTVEDDAAVVVLSRPESSNALTPSLFNDLRRALDSLDAVGRLRPIVLTGAGRCFSTGGDLRIIRDALDRDDGDPVEEANRSVSQLADVILRIRSMRSPVIAALNGQAAGAGFSLALACDVRIASERAVLNFAYGALGTSPDGGMTYFLPRMVGAARALELLIEQPMLRAPRALEEGLVSEVVAADDLLEAARRRARRLARKAPHSVRMARELIAAGLDSPLQRQLEWEREAFAAAVRTDDFRLGVAAMLAGERPVFEGR